MEPGVRVDKSTIVDQKKIDLERVLLGIEPKLQVPQAKSPATNLVVQTSKSAQFTSAQD